MNTFEFAQIGTYGQYTNQKKCFDARDEHFNCLDRINDELGNIFYERNFELNR